MVLDLLMAGDFYTVVIMGGICVSVLNAIYLGLSSLAEFLREA